MPALVKANAVFLAAVFCRRGWQGISEWQMGEVVQVPREPCQLWLASPWRGHKTRRAKRATEFGTDKAETRWHSAFSISNDQTDFSGNTKPQKWGLTRVFGFAPLFWNLNIAVNAQPSEPGFWNTPPSATTLSSWIGGELANLLWRYSARSPPLQYWEKQEDTHLSPSSEFKDLTGTFVRKQPTSMTRYSEPPTSCWQNQTKINNCVSSNKTQLKKNQNRIQTLLLPLGQMLAALSNRKIFYCPQSDDDTGQFLERTSFCFNSCADKVICTDNFRIGMSTILQLCEVNH